MSRAELHDLLVELESQKNNLGIIASAERQHLDQLVESLEQQQLDPEGFDRSAV